MKRFTFAFNNVKYYLARGGKEDENRKIASFCGDKTSSWENILRRRFIGIVKLIKSKGGKRKGVRVVTFSADGNSHRFYDAFYGETCRIRGTGG